MTTPISELSEHAFLTGIKASHVLSAFQGSADFPFLLRYGNPIDGTARIRCSVNYARVAESGRRAPDAQPFATKAREFLIAALNETPPAPAWSIWANQNPQLQAYTTSKILFGLGCDGVADIKPEYFEAAVSFLHDKTTEFCTPGSTVHPLLALLGLQCLIELKRGKPDLLIRAGHWADRLLYLAESHLTSGRISPLSPTYILFALGVLARAMPDAIDDRRTERLVQLVSDATGGLPAYSRASIIRVDDFAIGASAVDIITYLLESDRSRDAVLSCTPLLTQTFDWLFTHRIRVEGGTNLHRTDLYHDTNDIDLWFNCAIVDLVYTYKSCLANVERRQTLQTLNAEGSAAAFKWSDLKVGGFGWVKELQSRLLVPAQEKIPKGHKLEQNGIILFGPPGTSKTSVAQSIAAALGDWPIVTISPGTFLQEGPDRVFFMIEKIFRMLTRLSEAVVLFDEFELLVLDRGGNSRYSSWMTGLTTDVMLPWFKSMHDWGRNVYIIATNDIDSIDGAIRRVRRFDFILPVGPPSSSERLKLLEPILRNVAWDWRALNSTIDERATIGEVTQWAQEVRTAQLGGDAAKNFWSTEFAQSLQIEATQYQKFLEAAQSRTFPPSLK